ncbi:MAG: response regulator [Pyrinomonadaceae bacterium]
MPSAALLANGSKEALIANQSNHKHTILVVEDVAEISSSMSAALDKRGHRVMQASNAEQAIQIAEVNRPAIILTDLELPTFDKLLSALRGHADLNDTVVAIIDLNHPKVDGNIRVLPDFQALDDLLQSSAKSVEPSA